MYDSSWGEVWGRWDATGISVARSDMPYKLFLFAVQSLWEIPDILVMINFNSLTAEYDSPKQGKLYKLHDKDVRKTTPGIPQTAFA